MIDVIIPVKELKKAMAVIEKAKSAGFFYCEPIFSLISGGKNLHDCVMEYDGIIVRAHPTDPSLNWGRNNYMIENYQFKDGKLYHIE